MNAISRATGMPKGVVVAPARHDGDQVQAGPDIFVLRVRHASEDWVGNAH